MQLGAHADLNETGFLERIGDAMQFLGMDVVRVDGGFSLNVRSSLIAAAASDMGLGSCSPSRLPGARDTEEDDTLLDAAAHAQYRRVAGRWNWAAPCRPDIQYALNTILRKLSAPTISDQRRLKKLTRCMVGTAALRLELRPRLGPLRISVYVDSDWATRSDRRSVSGGCMQLCGALILSWARTQATLAQSSAEAELYAATTGAVEALFVQSLISDVFDVAPPVELFSDSAAALSCMTRPGLVTSRMKHIELRFLVIQEWIAKRRLVVTKEAGSRNGADLFTKFLLEVLFVQHRARVGMASGLAVANA